MNDNPYGRGSGCGPSILWLAVVGVIVIVIAMALGLGEDKYHCYTEPVGPTRMDNMLTGLSLEEAEGWQRRGLACYQSS